MTVRAVSRYDRRPGHGHVLRGEVGPPEARFHDHGRTPELIVQYGPDVWTRHAHSGGRRGRWEYVTDVRFCDVCQGPAVELLRGVDGLGRFEVWTCIDQCGRMGWWQNHRRDRDRFRLLGVFGSVGNFVILRDADYDAAALVRAKTRAAS